MVDPHNITSFHRTTAQLEEFLLNAIAFAGKNALQQSRKMHYLLDIESGVSPFENIRRWKRDSTFLVRLHRSKIGKYNMLSRSYDALAHSSINLRTCSIGELQTFPGVGPKTARFFILHSRPGQELIVIDTHVLKELRTLGMTSLRYTPTEKKYSQIEREVVSLLKGNGVRNFAHYDLAVWRKYSRRFHA